MEVVFKESRLLRDVPAGVVVLGLRLETPYVALRLAKHATFNARNGFTANQLILVASDKTAICKPRLADERDVVLIEPNVMLRPNADLKHLRIASDAQSAPGELEVWGDRIYLKVRSDDQTVPDVLVDLADGTVFFPSADPQFERSEVKYPAIISAWTVVREAVSATTAETLSTWPAAP